MFSFASDDLAIYEILYFTRTLISKQLSRNARGAVKLNLTHIIRFFRYQADVKVSLPRDAKLSHRRERNEVAVAAIVLVIAISSVSRLYKELDRFQI